MEFERKQLEVLEEKRMELISKDIFEETKIENEIINAFFQGDSHYVIIKDKNNENKKYIVCYGLLYKNEDYVQVGNILPLNKEINVYRHSQQLEEKRELFVNLMNENTDRVALDLYEEKEVEIVKQDLCYVMGLIQAAVSFKVIDEEEEEMINFILDIGTASGKRVNYKSALKEDSITFR